MAKKKTLDSIPNRSLYSRISFLYQAATYLAKADHHEQQTLSPKPAVFPVGESHDAPTHDDRPNLAAQQANNGATTAVEGLSRQLLADLRSVKLKTMIRISPEMKRTICKYCDSLLIEGKSCSSSIENKSKGGRKPWADVLVIKCNTCGREKRFPVAAQRQKRRPLRVGEAHERPAGQRAAETESQQQNAP